MTQPATSASVAAPPPLRFREDSAPGAGGVIEALIITVLLLAAALLAAVQAKKRGWLQRWTVAAGTTPSNAPSMQVLEVLRLSPRTRMFRVRCGSDECYVLESNVQASVVAKARMPGHADEP